MVMRLTPMPNNPPVNSRAVILSAGFQNIVLRPQRVHTIMKSVLENAHTAGVDRDEVSYLFFFFVFGGLF